MTISLNSLAGKLLFSFPLGFFLGIFLMPSFERDSFIFSFCLTFYVCLYELDKIAAFSSLGEMALCRLCVTGGFGRQVGAEQVKVLKGPGAALRGEARWPADPACSLSRAMCLGTHYSDLSGRPEHLDGAPPTWVEPRPPVDIHNGAHLRPRPGEFPQCPELPRRPAWSPASLWFVG